ncbi:MAG: DUF2911 domain-containing protein [Opitutaceae bacterium]
MKKITSLVLVFAALFVGALPLAAQQKRTSPHESIYARYGTRPNVTLVSITYGRPFSKDPKTGEMRKIWGGLVAWGKADRLGADEATLLLTQKALVFGETTVPAGAYTLYIVPSETGPTQLAISTNIGKWGVPLDEKNDLVRVTLTKGTLETSVDQLTLALDKNPDDTGTLKIMWEKTVYSVGFSVKK